MCFFVVFVCECVCVRVCVSVCFFVVCVSQLTSHCVEACLGNPLTSTPTSVVVPPISTTMALRRPDKNAAPLILLVGPEENVRTGYLLASSALGTETWEAGGYHMFIPGFGDPGNE